MEESLHDDVKALLDKDFGDDRILKQILRACENDEVISNFERNYVKKLAEKHLGRKPPVEPTEIPPKEEKPVPDVVIPEPATVQQTQTFQAPPPKITSGNKKNSKIMMGIGGIALVIIIAIAATYGGMSTNSPGVVDDPITPVDASLSIKSDLKSYDAKDLISISGNSETSGTANLSIENQDGDLVWTEQVSIKSNGSYSTLAIAGGPGWEKSGTYSLIVDNGKETKTTTFTFTA